MNLNIENKCRVVIYYGSSEYAQRKYSKRFELYSQIPNDKLIWKKFITIESINNKFKPKTK